MKFLTAVILLFTREGCSFYFFAAFHALFSCAHAHVFLSIILLHIRKGGNVVSTATMVLYTTFDNEGMKCPTLQSEIK